MNYQSLAATSSNSNQALLAGGTNGPLPGGGIVETYNNIDVFTDLSPVPVLSGSISGSPGKTITTQIFNTGDAPLAAGANVKIYATAVRGVIDASSALLGNHILAQPFAAADNKTLHIRTAIPSNLAGGKYFLLAAVDDSSTGQTVTTPIASSDVAYKLNGKSKPTATRTMMGAITGLFRRRK